MTIQAIANTIITTDDFQWLLIGITLALLTIVMIGVVYLVAREIEDSRYGSRVARREHRLEKARERQEAKDRHDHLD